MKKQQLLLGMCIGAGLLLMLVLTIAPNIDSRSMNPNQFNVAGNRLSITNWVRLTNVQVGIIRDDLGTNRIVQTANGATFFYTGSGEHRIQIDQQPGGSLKLQDANGSGVFLIHSDGSGEMDAPFDFFSVINPSAAAFFGSSINATGSVNVYGTGSSTLFLGASNALGGWVITPAHNLPVIITNIFNGSNFTTGWQWFVSASNNNVITWTSGPPATASGGSTQMVTFAAGSGTITNALALGTNIETMTQNPSLTIAGTNSAGVGNMVRLSLSNSVFSVDYGSNVTYGATKPMTLTGLGALSTAGAIAGGAAVSAATSLSAGTFVNVGLTSFIQFGARSVIDSAGADGNLGIYNNAQNNFTKLIFGGTTTAFPALGRTNGWLLAMGADGLFGGGDTNQLRVFAGGGSATAPVGGPVFKTFTGFTNHSTVGNFTNLASYTVPAHSLTNTGDGLKLRAGGVFLSGTNQLQVGYGSITNFMDTGNQTNGASSAWECQATITRTGTTSQHIDGEFSWNQGNGTPFSRTNFNAELAETNGISNVLKLAGRAIRSGGITNNSFVVEFSPAP